MRVSKDELYLEISNLKEENNKIKSENADLRFENSEKTTLINHVKSIIQNGDETGENFFKVIDKIKNELDAYQNNLVQ